MRIILCDDNVEVTAQLNEYLLEYFKKYKLKTPEIDIFDTGDKLLEDTGAKDIVFLDVEMPGISGIHVGASLKKQNKHVIIFIVTAFTEYLDDAMRFHVFRYLSKPIEKERLFRNFRDALKKYSTYNINLPVETKAETFIINMNEIVMIEAQGRHTIVRTTSRDYNSLSKMDYWTTRLADSCFFQSHRSYIVHLRYVTSFDHALIHLCNGEFAAYLTKRKYSAFKEHYLLYLESRR